jgi:glycine/D-amino acid oxidase-like deaminating enzyme
MRDPRRRGGDPDGMDSRSGRRYPRHWFALGYGGNGMTLGFLAARLLVGQGLKSRDHALFEFGRLRNTR